jgi:hypothetical protein
MMRGGKKRAAAATAAAATKVRAVVAFKLTTMSRAAPKQAGPGGLCWPTSQLVN